MESASGSSSDSEDLAQGASSNIDHINQLLQNRRGELMNELKALQHDERPVTGTSSRTTVNQFLARRLFRTSAAAHVANIDAVEEHRPEQVVVEVQGLLQRRSVTSILHSSSFRRSLESVIRGHVISGIQPASSASNARSSGTSNGVNRTTVETTSSAGESQSTIVYNLPQRSTNEVPVFETVQQAQREQLIMEISELVHQSLVTQTLSSGFRNALERRVMERLQASGTDGQRVQEVIHSLPPSNIRRNDFSHLGLQTTNDLDDAISVVSATATATIPYTQSNAAVTREISGLKAQIAQLTSMLKTSLDLQMDIQRSIRQEVAAAIGHATGIPAQCQSRRADDSKCLICLEGAADAVFYRCGHICSCYTCAMRLKSQNNTCPVCRAPIADILRAYRITHE